MFRRVEPPSHVINNDEAFPWRRRQPENLCQSSSKGRFAKHCKEQRRFAPDESSPFRDYESSRIEIQQSPAEQTPCLAQGRNHLDVMSLRNSLRERNSWRQKKLVRRLLGQLVDEVRHKQWSVPAFLALRHTAVHGESNLTPELLSATTGSCFYFPLWEFTLQKLPKSGTSFASLQERVQSFLSFLLSYAIVEKFIVFYSLRSFCRKLLNSKMIFTNSPMKLCPSSPQLCNCRIKCALANFIFKLEFVPSTLFF